MARVYTVDSSHHEDCTRSLSARARLCGDTASRVAKILLAEDALTATSAVLSLAVKRLQARPIDQ